MIKTGYIVKFKLPFKLFDSYTWYERIGIIWVHRGGLVTVIDKKQLFLFEELKTLASKVEVLKVKEGIRAKDDTVRREILLASLGKPSSKIVDLMYPSITEFEQWHS